MSALSNTCPRSIDPELWEGMSADARYGAQLETRKQSQRIGIARWLLLAPPLLFMTLPPVQALVEKVAPPEHYVKINGTVDPRNYLDKSAPKVGDEIAGSEVTSAYGVRVHPVTFETTMHNGVDVSEPVGTPLYAPAVGADKVTVQCWEDAGGGGTVANVQSESIKAFRFKAMHLSSCTEGEYTAGQVFAKTGNTGMSTAAHLHLGQMPADADTYVQPMRGYVEWFLSGSSGADFIDIPALKDSIIGQESGGNPSAVNPHSGALGLGQVMPENLAGEGRGWDYDALGRDVSPSEFLANPKLQDEIIEHQLGAIAQSQSVAPDGSKRSDVDIAKRSAAVWYSGRGDYCSSTGGESFGAGAYPSGAEYCSSVGAKYEQSKTLQQKRLIQLDKK